MAFTDKYISHPGAILADVKVATFVRKMAIGIARAQRKLDRNSVAMAQELATTKLSDITGVAGSGKSLLELGLSPAFYHFPEVEIKVSMMLHIREERTRELDLSAHGSKGDQFGYSKNTNSVGTADLTVLHRPASAAKAVITLNRNEAGSVVLDGTTFELSRTLPASDTVAIVGGSMQASAEALAVKLKAAKRDNKALIADATVKMVQLAAPPMSTSEPAAFVIDKTRGRIRVVHSGKRPALRFVSVRDNRVGSIEIPGGGGGNPTVSLSATATAGNARFGLTAEESALNLADAVDQHLANGTGAADAVALSVFFATGVGDRFTVGREAIDLAVQYLRENPSESALLVGHADASGGDRSNLLLSESRADTVRKAFEDAGIGVERLITQALGEARPASRDYARNRRVEIRLTRSGNASAVENLVALRSLQTGISAELNVAVTGTIEEFWGRDGLDGLPVGGETVTVAGVSVEAIGSGGTTAPSFAIGSSANATAINLAAALELALPALGFSASGDVVRVETAGTVAQITLTTALLGDDANAITLTADPAPTNTLTIASPFRGARAAGELTGASVAVGELTLVAGTDFQGGGTQEQTAANIHAALTARLNKPFEFALSGNGIRVTGPSGTPLRATPPGVLKFSAAALPGQPNEETISASDSEAYGGTLDIHNTKKFEIDITGFSELKVRMVAIPAPVEFLDEIKAYLEG